MNLAQKCPWKKKVVSWCIFGLIVRLGYCKGDATFFKCKTWAYICKCFLRRYKDWNFLNILIKKLCLLDSVTLHKNQIQKWSILYLVLILIKLTHSKFYLRYFHCREERFQAVGAGGNRSLMTFLSHGISKNVRVCPVTCEGWTHMRVVIVKTLSLTLFLSPVKCDPARSESSSILLHIHNISTHKTFPRLPHLHSNIHVPCSQFAHSQYPNQISWTSTSEQ